MKIGEGTIHANPGKVLDCACAVGVECDGETIALRFPTIERADDNIGPMVYAHMRGTELHVTLCDREDADIEFAWDEGEGKWRAVGTANAAGQGAAKPYPAPAGCDPVRRRDQPECKGCPHIWGNSNCRCCHVWINAHHNTTEQARAGSASPGSAGSALDRREA